MYEIQFSKKSIKDIEKLKQSGLDKKAKNLVEIIKHNPPPFEKLIGNLNGFISRRINIQHRLVYKVSEEEKVVKMYRMWSHYE